MAQYADSVVQNAVDKLESEQKIRGRIEKNMSLYLQCLIGLV